VQTKGKKGDAGQVPKMEGVTSTGGLIDGEKLGNFSWFEPVETARGKGLRASQERLETESTSVRGNPP